jgi:hypothetical protein
MVAAETAAEAEAAAEPEVVAAEGGGGGVGYRAEKAAAAYQQCARTQSFNFIVFRT